MQNEIINIELASNPSKRIPCVLLLDTSTSMTGLPINELNNGLRVFKEAILKDSKAQQSVEVCIITFDSDINVIQEFTGIESMQVQILQADGKTVMCTGILKAFEKIDARKKIYKQNQIPYFRPWIFMITDGEPYGEHEGLFNEVKNKIERLENENKIIFYAVGVESANMSKLKELSKREPLKLKGLNFGELFLWLSSSLGVVSRSSNEMQIKLLPPSNIIE